MGADVMAQEFRKEHRQETGQNSTEQKKEYLPWYALGPPFLSRHY
jgi:hypothetical protein